MIGKKRRVLPLSTLATIALALCTCLLAVHFAVPPSSRRRWVRARVLGRALVPRRILRSRSGQLDIAAFLFSVFLLGTVLGWALVSSDVFARAAEGGLAELLGEPQDRRAPAWLAAGVMTLGMYLAYEFAYWLNHWLSHRSPILWEFHKVHHSAESLSTLTNFRVHPVDTLVFYNMAAAITGGVAGTISFAFGRPVDAWAIGGSNLLIFASSWLLTYLQHSHIWMSFHGPLGKLLVSPAHHQIHHSAEPRHHNRNFGSTLAVWDWLFGTLHMPTRQRERLRFGVDGLPYDPHSVKGALLMPFVDALPQTAPRDADTPADVPAATQLS
jgi:sterol desaturase/sphingolipid hydroxylase (fatty acid hydroxylase superfamily)